MTNFRISAGYLLLPCMICLFALSAHEANAASASRIQVQLAFEDEDLNTKSRQFVPLPTPRSDHVTIDDRATHLRGISSDSQRRELSFWSSFMNFVHCPIHHDKNPHCDHHHHHSGGGGGSHSSGGGSGGGGSGGSGSGGGGSGGGGGSSPDSNNNNGGNNNNNNNNNNGGNNNNNNGGNNNNNGGNNNNNGGNNNNNGGDTNNGSTVTCDNNGCKDQNGNDVVTCNGNGCFDENNNYVGNNCDANGCCDQNGICYDVNSLGGSPTQSPSPLDTVSNDDPEWSNLSSEMIYGAIGLSGLAVAAGLLVRRRRQDVNLNDHLLNGAVNKRKRTFAKLFRKKSMDPETPGATHYVKA